MKDELILAVRSLNFSKEDLDNFELLLQSAEKICDKIRPLAPKWDEEGCKLENNKAVLPKGMKEIYDEIAASGL